MCGTGGAPPLRTIPGGQLEWRGWLAAPAGGAHRRLWRNALRERMSPTKRRQSCSAGGRCCCAAGKRPPEKVANPQRSQLGIPPIQASYPAQGLGSWVLVCRLASLRHGCLAPLQDLTSVAIKAEQYEDTFVADVQPVLPLPALRPHRVGAGAGPRAVRHGVPRGPSPRRVQGYSPA